MKPPLRIAILECDTPAPDTHAKYKGYGGVFTRLLNLAADGMQDEGLSTDDLDLSAWDVVHKQEYPDLDEVDALLFSGSKHNSFDNDPWILKLVDFTQKVLAQSRVRMIGVCFGHQIIGRAMGAKVGRSHDGWELSAAPFKLSDKGQQLFKKETLTIMQMHRDIVFEYPAGVDELGSSPLCLVQGMYTKNRLISVQGHPEFNEEMMRELLDRRHAGGVLNKELYDDGIARVANQQDGIAIAQAFLRFLLED